MSQAVRCDQMINKLLWGREYSADTGHSCWNEDRDSAA